VVREGDLLDASGVPSFAESVVGSLFAFGLPSFAERRLLVAMR